MIDILTGPVRSGKTTSILNLRDLKKHIGGFATPDTNGKRIIVNLLSDEMAPFEKNENEREANDVIVGKFRFSRQAFDLGHEWMMSHMENPSLTHLVLDEVGKLELQNLGFFSLFKDWTSFQTDKKRLVVVRDYLVQDVIHHFNLRKFRIWVKEDLKIWEYE